MKYNLSAMIKNDVGRVAMATALALSFSLLSMTRTNAQTSIKTGIDTTLPSSDGLNGSAAPHGAKGSNPDGVERWEWDGSDGGGENQGLLWFDIPQGFLDGFGAGATATLKLFNDNNGDSGDLHRITVDWLTITDGGDDITFDGFPDGPGIIPGTNAQEVSNVSTGVLTPGPYEFDVTVDVQAWVSGEPNYGWGFLPTGGDGNGIVSFEHETDPVPELVLMGVSLSNGDFNGDGTIDLNDYGIMLSNFHNEGTFEEGDFDFDGRIGLLDFVGFRRAFLAQPAGAASVPEPSSISLFGLGGLLLLGRRRHAG